MCFRVFVKNEDNRYLKFGLLSEFSAKLSGKIVQNFLLPFLTAIFASFAKHLNYVNPK